MPSGMWIRAWARKLVVQHLAQHLRPGCSSLQGPQLGTSGLLSIVQDITYPGRLHHQGAQGGIKAGEGEAEASGVSFEEESEEEEDHRKDSCRRGGDLL